MIEDGITYRARPKCTRCGWIGRWRTSNTSSGTATDLAQHDLAEHTEFWHEDAA